MDFLSNILPAAGEDAVDSLDSIEAARAWAARLDLEEMAVLPSAVVANAANGAVDDVTAGLLSNMDNLFPDAADTAWKAKADLEESALEEVRAQVSSELSIALVTGRLDGIVDDQASSLHNAMGIQAAHASSSANSASVLTGFMTSAASTAVPNLGIHKQNYDQFLAASQSTGEDTLRLIGTAERELQRAGEARGALSKSASVFSMPLSFHPGSQSIPRVPIPPESRRNEGVRPMTESVRYGSKDRTDEERKRSELGYGRFNIPSSKKAAEYIWVPKEKKLDKDLVDKILKQWKLKKPSLLLCFDSGFTHPLHLIEGKSLNEDDVLEDRFTTLRECVSCLDDEDCVACKTKGKKRAHCVDCKRLNEKKHNCAACKKEEEKKPDCEACKKEEERYKNGKLKEMNRILKRSVFNIVRTIVQVATQQNVWIVIQGRPTGITVLLEEVIKILPNIIVLVVDSPCKEGNTDVKNKMKMYTKHLKKLKIQGRPASKEEKAERTANIKTEVEETVKTVKTLNQKILDGKVIFDQPSCIPWDMDDTKDSSFWKGDNLKKGWTQQSASDEGAEMIRWNQWIYRSGTHYIFLDTESSDDFKLDMIAPTGSVYMGGGGSTKEAIMRSMRLGLPTVLLHNTGRATQQLTIVHTRLKREFARIKMPGGRTMPAAKLTNEKQAKLFEELQENCACHDPDSVLQTEDIIELYQMYLQRAHIIEQTCVALDPLDDKTNEQQVEIRVSDCFAANYRISTSVAYESASRKAIAAAWQLHAQLSSTCAVHKVSNDCCLTLVLMLGFFSLVVSVGLLETDTSGTFFHLYDVDKSDPTHDFLKYMVIFLPALNGLVGTISSRMRFRQTWGLMKSASCMIESEIFKFRVRIQDYAVVGGADAGGGAAERQSREKHVRDVFTDRVRQIFTGYLSDISAASLKPCIPLSEVAGYATAAGVMSLQKQGGFDSPKVQDEAKKIIDVAGKEKIAEEEEDKLQELEIKVPQRSTKNVLKTVSQSLEKTVEEYSKPKEDADSSNDDDTDVGSVDSAVCEPVGALMDPELGNCSAQTYYRERTLPTLVTMTKEAGRIQRVTNRCEVIIGASAVAASILGAVNSDSVTTVAFVPIFVSIGATVTTVVQQHSFYARLSALNSAVRMLARLDMDWNSASPLEQCSLELITRLVDTTEYCRVAVMNAWTAMHVSSGSESNVGSNTGKAEGDKKKKGSEAEEEPPV